MGTCDGERELAISVLNGPATAAVGLPAAIAVGVAASERPTIAVVVALLSSTTLAAEVIARSPAGHALARGRVARRLLRTAAEEARRTDAATLQGAVEQLLAAAPDVHGPPLTGGEAGTSPAHRSSRASR